MLAILIAVALAALLPAAMYFANVRIFHQPPSPSGEPVGVSVLIPARNEEGSIEACVRSVLASVGVDLEVIVLDDHSIDRTATIVREIAATDPRLRCETAPPLPPGWSGKQHACFALSKLATKDVFSFLDADVRLAPDALSRLAAFQRDSRADLVSGFPRQETGTILEKLLIPMIHWLLLGFLPFARMRVDRRPGLGAGCGQWFLTTRSAYDRVGGHAVIQDSFHDGIKLPRAFRAAGLMTDLCDVTDLATCRMYRTAGQVWFGFAKNAREGLGHPKLLPFFTLLFLAGQVGPWVLLALAPWQPLFGWAAIPAVLTLAPRLHAARHFRQSWLSAILHPVGVVLVLTIQWFANVRSWVGKPIGWKGRVQPTTPTWGQFPTPHDKPSP
jgi:glycosyltransferase involved in cell wall biosynthesis